MTFCYPRKITVKRQAAGDAAGERGYGGVVQADESIIATGLAAHIEAERQGTAPVARLPADAAGESLWTIIVKVKLGLIRSRDVLVDELGNRYQVISADWGPMVTSCRCQILEA